MVGGRSEVLPDGQDFHVVGPHVAEDLDDFVDLLPQPEHDARLREDRRVHPLRALQQLQRPRVTTLRPHLRVQAGDGLDVVIENVRAGAHHGGQRRLVTHEIRDQDFDAALRNPLADLPDGPGEDRRPAVFQLVAVDGGDDRVLEAHPLHGLRDSDRLTQVEHIRAAGLHGAEAAGPGAGVAQDHEGGGACFPALADVGAARLLTDRVQLEHTHDVLELGVVRAAGKPHPQPLVSPGIDGHDRIALGATVELDGGDVSHCYQYPKGRPNSVSIHRDLLGEAFEPAPDALEESGGRDAVEHPVVEAQAEIHHRSDGYRISVHHNWPLYDRVHRQDTRLRRRDDRVRQYGAEGPRIVDREGRALHVRDGERPGSRPLGQVVRDLGQPGDRQAVRLVDDRHDQAVLHRHRDTDVDVLVHHDSIVAPTGVQDGHGFQALDHRLDDDRHEGQVDPLLLLEAIPCLLTEAHDVAHVDLVIRT